MGAKYSGPAITRKMLDAGLEILADHSAKDGDAARDETVSAIFEAMYSLAEARLEPLRHQREHSLGRRKVC